MIGSMLLAFFLATEYSPLYNCFLVTVCACKLDVSKIQLLAQTLLVKLQVLQQLTRPV